MRKRLLVAGIMLCTAGMAMAQLPKQISPAELSKLKLKVAAAAEAKKQTLLKDSKIKDSQSDVSITFLTDTMKIEQFFKQRLEVDYSTAGMVEASLDAEKEYDVLLNKYYQQLLKMLKPKDKPLLVEVQRNWVKYRDAEYKMNGLLTEEHYSGGGTMQRIIYAGAVLELTKRRVFELNSYLERIVQWR